MSVRSYPEADSVFDQITQVVIFGNSVFAPNAGVTAPDRDLMSRLAAMTKAKEFNYARGGAVLSWGNDQAAASNLWGVYPTLFQAHKRPVRAATTIASVDPAVGATNVTCAHAIDTTSATGVRFRVDDTVMVGTGDTGATGGEMMQVANTVGSVLHLKSPTGWETGSAGLLRDHAIGDPVYAMPTHYQAGNTIYLLCEAHNQLARYTPNAALEAVYKGALRSCIARLRCSEIFEPNHTALKFTGTWGAAASSTTVLSGLAANAGQGTAADTGGRAANALNAAVEFHLPDNFPGGTAVMQFVANKTSTGTAVWTFTVDGNAAGTLTANAPLTQGTPGAMWHPYCKRFTGLSAGRHKLVAQMTTAEVPNLHYFDFAGVEAEFPPIVIVFVPHRLYHYALYTSSWAHGFIRATLAAEATAAATSCSVNQAEAAWRQIAAGSIPAVDEYITLSPGTGTEETKKVLSVTGTGPFTINFATDSPGGQGLASSHASGNTIYSGIHDYPVRSVMRPWVESVVGEFDEFVIPFDPDSTLNKERANFFGSDLSHANDHGHALIAKAVYDQLHDDARINSSVTAFQSRPVGLSSTQVLFLATGVAVVWTDMPAALSEFPLITGGPGNFRRQRDLSGYEKGRICVNQTVAGASGSRLRIQYSLDGGTTWAYLFKKVLDEADETSAYYGEPALAADLTCQINLTGTGLKTTSWHNIYPDALQDVQLRVAGIGGNGTADPAFFAIYLELR